MSGPSGFIIKMEEQIIIEKLQTMEKYIRRAIFAPYIKKKMIFRFHEIFHEEMKETETGKKWRGSLEKC